MAATMQYRRILIPAGIPGVGAAVSVSRWAPAYPTTDRRYASPHSRARRADRQPARQGRGRWPMYVAMRDGIFRSDNAGETWARVTNGPKNVATVTVNPMTPSELYAATMDGKIFRSIDGGMRWNESR